MLATGFQINSLRPEAGARIGSHGERHGTNCLLCVHVQFAAGYTDRSADAQHTHTHLHEITRCMQLFEFRTTLAMAPA